MRMWDVWLEWRGEFFCPRRGPGATVGPIHKKRTVTVWRKLVSCKEGKGGKWKKGKGKLSRERDGKPLLSVIPLFPSFLAYWTSANLTMNVPSPKGRGEKSATVQSREKTIAVGTVIADRPPRRSVRAELPHTALTSNVDLQTARPDKNAESSASAAIAG